MKLTLEEKMRLVTGMGFWHTYDANGKLPSLHLSDGPHGLRKQPEGGVTLETVIATCFPTASAVASTWDPSLAGLMGSRVAMEAFNEEVSVLLGPGTNMKRSPLCGRNFEYFSEDPYLAGMMGTGFVNGVQSIGIGTSLKHFCGNNQETKRMTSNSMIDERALREIYLRAFELIVKNSNPATIMAAYNRVDGLYATENKKILTDILRNEWGFKGLVVSDWGACIKLADAVKAGMDLEMPDSHGAHNKGLLKAYNNKEITEADLDVAVNRIVNLGKLYSVENRTKKDKYDISLNHEYAIKVEEEAAVLLENDGILPLNTKNVVIIGGLANTVRYQGGGSSRIHTRYVMGALEAFKNAGFNAKYSLGYSAENARIDTKLEDEALATVDSDDIVLFFGGLPEFAEGEGYDRNTLEMPENQISLFNRLYQKNKNIVFISFGGAPYNIVFRDKCKAILQMYLGGEGVMEACANLVSGKVNPSGKLAETFPLSIEDTPAYGYFATGSKDVKYKESIFIGYRYYDTFGVDVAYPFGYGKSYTTFEYSNLKVNNNEVSFTITNTGKVKGKEIAQVYVSNLNGNYIKAKQELRGFTKVELEPNESKNVTIKLDDNSFRLYDLNRGFIKVGGEYEIRVGASSRDIRLNTIINVDGEEYSNNDRNEYPEFFDMNNKLHNITDEMFAKHYGKEVSHLDNVKPGEFTLYNSLVEAAPYSKLAREVLENATKDMRERYKDKPDDDPDLIMMLNVIKDGSLDCIQMVGTITYDQVEQIVNEVNSK